MMKNIGNIENNDWITQVVDKVLSMQGILRPRQGGVPSGEEGYIEWQKAIDAGYDPNAVYFQMFTKDNLQIEFQEFQHVKENNTGGLLKCYQEILCQCI